MTVYIVGIPYLEIDQARRPGEDVVPVASQLGDRAAMVQRGLSFAGLLRRLRTEACLTQEELAEASGLSPRSISDLERGINLTARKTTALLLADALHIPVPVRSLFVAAARGRAPAIEVLVARDRPPSQGPLEAGTSADDVADILYRGPGLAQLIAAVTTADAARDGGMHGNLRDRGDDGDRHDRAKQWLGIQEAEPRPAPRTELITAEPGSRSYRSDGWPSQRSCSGRGPGGYRCGAV